MTERQQDQAWLEANRRENEARANQTVGGVLLVTGASGYFLLGPDMPVDLPELRG